MKFLFNYILTHLCCEKIDRVLTLDYTNRCPDNEGA